MKSLSTYLTRNAARLLFAVAVLFGCAAGILDPEAALALAVIGNFETVAGSTLACSTAAPATFDAPGYGALTYTIIGEITDLGGNMGREYNTVSHSPIDSAQVIEKKGSYRLGSQDITVAWDQSDAGQDILRTAADDQDQILSFKLTKQNGDIRYFTAQVAKFVENHGTVDNVVQGLITLLRQKPIVHSPA